MSRIISAGYIIGMLMESLAFAQSPANLTVLNVNVNSSFQDLSGSLDKFQNLPCLTGQAKKHLGNLQNNVSQANSLINKQYANYSAYVTKPMLGDGRCSGGFQAVAKESENRRVASQAFAAQLTSIRAQFNQAVAADLADANIDTADESEDSDCAKAGESMYGSSLVGGLGAFVSVTAFRSGVDDVTKRFQSYAMTNGGLGDNCGAIPNDLSGMLLPGGAAAGSRPVPKGPQGGNSYNPSSTVTGNIDDASLAEAGNTSKLKVIGANIALSSGTNEKSASTITSSSRAPAAKARAERESVVKTFDSKLGPIASGDNHSEELELKSMLGSNGENADRAPASADAKPAAPMAHPSVKLSGPSANDRAAWDSGLPGTCFEAENCAGKTLQVKGPAECPATHRYFRQSLPGGVCQKLPAK